MGNFVSGRLLFLVAVLFLFTLNPIAEFYAQQEDEFKENYAHKQTQEQIELSVSRVFPALVRINVLTMSASGGRMRKFSAAGSGVIIDKEGHIVTNHHVAGNATRIVCRMHDGEEIEADLIGTDPLADIAVVKLKLEHRRENATPIQAAFWGNSDKVQVGDSVLALGSPAALSQSVTKGIVSNTQMILPPQWWFIKFTLDGEDVGTLVRWIGHDAEIFGGNSGGPLINMVGEVIGINEVGIGSLGGAIPGNLARSVAEQLIQYGHVKRSWIGLECQPRLKSYTTYNRGVLVRGVVQNSPAEKAGLTSGDIVIEYDDVLVDCRTAEDLPLFNKLVLSTEIGKKVKVVFIRGTEIKTTILVTDERERMVGKDEEIRSWGITARNFTRMYALEKRRKDQDGVFVDTIRSGGPCSESKPSLTHGDVIVEVNGKRVKDIAHLRQISQEISADQTSRTPVLVGFERGKQHYLTLVKIGKESPAEAPASARKSWFAVSTQVLTRQLAKALKLGRKKGVRITQVYPGHNAEKAGFKVGDVLLKLDGTVIDASLPEDYEVLKTRIRQYKIGSKVEFELRRNGTKMTLGVELEAPPTPAAELKRYKDDSFEITVRNMSSTDKASKGMEKNQEGVYIERVESAGWASLGRVALGDILLAINGEATPEVGVVEKLLKQAKEQQVRYVVFFVKRGIHHLFLEIEPAWEETK